MRRWGRRPPWPRAEAAYVEGVEASRAGDLRRALRALAWAEERYTAQGDDEGRAGAARSAWRAANCHAADGALATALTTGQRSVEGFAAALAALAATATTAATGGGVGTDDVRRELVRAGADTSVFAVQCRRFDLAVELATAAVDTARTAFDQGLDRSRDLLTELGTARHNLAAALFARATRGMALVAGPPADERVLEELRAALRVADEEVRLRRELVAAASATDRMPTWELASGLVQRGRIRFAAGERESAELDLNDADRLAAGLGIAGRPLLAQVAAARRLLGGEIIY